MNQQCKVCGEPAAGFHFGAFTCEGCKSFFGRSYNNLSSISECKNNGECVINKKNRTSCKACRLRKCLLVGMSKSGSRYGRRSNWFKIHCLLQEQQQKQGKSDPLLPGSPYDQRFQVQLAAAAALGRGNKEELVLLGMDDVGRGGHQTPTPPVLSSPESHSDPSEILLGHEKKCKAHLGHPQVQPSPYAHYFPGKDLRGPFIHFPSMLHPHPAFLPPTTFFPPTYHHLLNNNNNNNGSRKAHYEEDVNYNNNNVHKRYYGDNVVPRSPSLSPAGPADEDSPMDLSLKSPGAGVGSGSRGGSGSASSSPRTASPESDDERHGSDDEDDEEINVDVDFATENDENILRRTTPLDLTTKVV